MAFVAAMNSPPIHGVGVKGSNVYTEAGVGDVRVSLFTMLVRDYESAKITRIVGDIFKNGSEEMIRDLIVMAFQTRDIRGGKGERNLFYHMMTAVLDERPEWARGLLELVPEYGYWKDMWQLWTNNEPCVRDVIDEIVKEQFDLDKESEHPSLLVKWLPREGGELNDLAHHFAYVLFPLTPKKDGQRMRAYRKSVAYLNRLVDTTEIKMCGRTWADIQPKKVPGRLFKQCKNAFFNKKRKNESEDRYPDNEDRKVCAEHFKEFMADVKSGKVEMKGGTTVMPHEIVKEILSSRGGGQDADDVRQAMWDTIRKEVLTGGGLGKCVFMCDFSGSMEGTPKLVSLALGILGSECATPAFKDHILTFDSTPAWHSFADKTTLREKVESIDGIGHGLSTNFQAAADLVLQKLVEHAVPVDEAPQDLIVLTDMGFDAANEGSYGRSSGIWQTHFQRIRDQFQKAGYTPPRIVCWNLRAAYEDFHATAHEEGVVQLSGWSPAVLKAIQGEGVQVATPYDGLRRLLDAPRYDRVRAVVAGLLLKV
jgi:hypothetical protein